MELKRRYSGDSSKDVEQLAALLVGRRIVAVTKQYNPSGDWDNWHDLGLELDDGICVQIESTGYEADGVAVKVVPPSKKD